MGISGLGALTQDKSALSTAIALIFFQFGTSSAWCSVGQTGSDFGRGIFECDALGRVAPDANHNLRFLPPIFTSSGGGTQISSLSDEVQPEVEAYIDVLSASVVQDGGRLTFTAITREEMPTTVSQSGDFVRLIWFVDADLNGGTGQPNGTIGSEFNVRAVVDTDGINGFIDVTGALPGGGNGSVAIAGDQIEMTIWLGQIDVPLAFNWNVDACAFISGGPNECQGHTASASATTLPYTPPSSVELLPPLLMLSPSGTQSGQLQVVVRDENGIVQDPGNYEITFAIDDTGVATVQQNGVVTAVATPSKFGDTPRVYAFADGVASSNGSVIRSTDVDLGIEHQPYPGRNVSFYVPPAIDGADLDSIITSLQIVQATDWAYDIERVFVGTTTFGGNTHHLVLDPANDGTEPCGISGNPVRLGWALGPPIHNSCFIVNDPPVQAPQWFIYWHELGHDFTLHSQGFGGFVFSYDPMAWVYVEGLASLAAMAVWTTLDDCNSGLSPAALMSISEEAAQAEQRFQDALLEYQTTSATYDDITPDILDGILFELRDDYGTQAWFDFFSCFVPQGESLPCSISTREDQATFFVAAFSASTGQDLRSRFATDYKFPINNATWANLLNCAQQRIALRPYSSADSNVNGVLNLCESCPNNENPNCAVPTMGQYGLIIMSGLIVIAGALLLRRRQSNCHG